MIFILISQWVYSAIGFQGNERASPYYEQISGMRKWLQGMRIREAYRSAQNPSTRAAHTKSTLNGPNTRMVCQYSIYIHEQSLHPTPPVRRLRDIPANIDASVPMELFCVEWGNFTTMHLNLNVSESRRFLRHDQVGWRLISVFVQGTECHWIPSPDISIMRVNPQAHLRLSLGVLRAKAMTTIWCWGEVSYCRWKLNTPPTPKED